MNEAGAVAAVLAGIILLGGAIKALPTIWSFIKAAAKVPIVVESVAAEFSPNGGSSLRDAVNRIEHQHGERLTAIEKRLAALEDA